jgi:hypothetical protein
MTALVLAQTVVSEFTDRFLQAERSNIVQLVTLVSLFAALVIIPRLVKMMQRGDLQFNNALWRWALGILFTLLFPNFLSMILLKRPVTEVVLTTPTAPVKSASSGFIEDDTMHEWLDLSQTEKSNRPQSQLRKADYAASELGPTVINPQADPGNYGIDIRQTATNE